MLKQDCLLLDERAGAYGSEKQFHPLGGARVQEKSWKH
jgi:hypothetical protein